MNNNVYADIITENRYIASKQLVASEFSSKDWKNYRQLCKVMVDEALKVYHNSTDMRTFDLAVVGLFSMFGMNDASKGIFKYRIRMAMACLQMKKDYSDEYKDARKALAAARKARNAAEDAITEDMTAESNPTEFQTLASAVAKVEEYENILENLASEPNHVWWDVKALSSKKDKELGIARKHIEDTIADIIRERSNMTDADRAIEKGQLDGGREVAKELKKAQA